MPEMHQIYELMWQPHTIAQLKPAAVGRMEQRGASFDDSVDEPERAGRRSYSTTAMKSWCGIA